MPTHRPSALRLLDWKRLHLHEGFEKKASVPLPVYQPTVETDRDRRCLLQGRGDVGMRNTKPLPELHCDRRIMHCQSFLIEPVAAPHLIPRDTHRTVGPALPLILSFRTSQACMHLCVEDSGTARLAARSLLDAKPGQCLHIGLRRPLATLSARDARSRRPAPHNRRCGGESPNAAPPSSPSSPRRTAPSLRLNLRPSQGLQLRSASLRGTT